MRDEVQKDNYIKLWGTRGSVPVSGAEYLKFGGNTACMEISYQGHCIVIDCGSGARPLGYKLRERGVTDVTLILSHLHWDHILGLPFFDPLYSPNAKIDLWGPCGHGCLKKYLAMVFDEKFFPGPTEDFPSDLTHHNLTAEVRLDFGDLSIVCHRAHHPGLTLCFKIITPNKTIGYCTDNEFLQGVIDTDVQISADDPALGPYLDFIEFYKDCDVLIHEAQYNGDLYPAKVGWGHTSVPNSCKLMGLTDVKEHLVVHHDPGHTDELLMKKWWRHQQLIDEADIDCRVTYLGDGHIIAL